MLKVPPHGTLGLFNFCYPLDFITAAIMHYNMILDSSIAPQLTGPFVSELSLDSHGLTS